MEQKEVIIRPARPEDEPVASRLMYDCGPNLALTIFGKPESHAIRAFAEVFPLPDHMQSYTHAFVAESDGDVVGLFLGFDKKTWEASKRASSKIGFRWLKLIRPWHTPRMIQAIIDLNRTLVPILDEDYCIQYLAVLPELRGQGIGRQLMEFAEGRARAKGLKKVVLDVLVENEGARRFYEELGFRGTKAVTDQGFCKRFGVQGSIRMVKPIANSVD